MVYPLLTEKTLVMLNRDTIQSKHGFQGGGGEQGFCILKQKGGWHETMAAAIRPSEKDVYLKKNYFFPFESILAFA